MAEIIIRFEEKGRAKELDVILNKQKIGSLSRGNTGNFLCSDNAHTILLKNEGYITNELKFYIKKDEKKTFIVSKPSLFVYVRILFWLAATSFCAHKAIGIGYYLFFGGLVGFFLLALYSKNRYNLKLVKE
ncbi:hypothetical protein [Aquimarina longa]|uniref:hypothetical protein n=1 Tax=Aquimarina longa TaxID=1080221 RepID=UPI000785A76B|nr:hypothetical protein [Aquimarina longa]